MAGADILRVLADVAEEHQQQADGTLRVVPVLVTDVDPPIAMIGAVVDHLGGVLLDATADDFAGAVAAVDDPLLRGEIQAAMSVTGARLSVSLTLEAGLIDATIARDGQLISGPTGGERHLLQIVRALNDARLGETDLAVLAYRETILDFDSRAQVLELLTGLAARPSLGTVRTLLVIVESAGLSVTTHCGWPGGVRYSLETDRLVKRHPPSSLGPIATRLATQRTRPPVFFLAAGFSASSGMPVGNSIRDSTIRRLAKIPSDDTSTSEELALAFWEWAKQHKDLLRADELADGRERFASLLALEQVVRIEAKFTDETPQTLRDLQQLHDDRLSSGKPYGDAIYQMQRILEHDRPLILTTVNYDELLESVAADYLDVAVTPEDFARLDPILAEMREGGKHPEGKVPYLKLHGTMSRLETCVATDTVTRSGLSDRARDALLTLIRLDNQLDSTMLWIYVGASMRDIDLEKNVLAQPEFGRGAIRETWVAPSIEASVLQFIDRNPRARLADPFQHSITETADAFTRAFADAWVGRT